MTMNATRTNMIAATKHCKSKMVYILGTCSVRVYTTKSATHVINILHGISLLHCFLYIFQWRSRQTIKVTDIRVSMNNSSVTVLLYRLTQLIEYFESLDGDAKARHKKKLELAGLALEEDPYAPVNQGNFKDNIAAWPCRGLMLGAP